jgi:hypothetical protein
MVNDSEGKNREIAEADWDSLFAQTFARERMADRYREWRIDYGENRAESERDAYDRRKREYMEATGHYEVVEGRCCCICGGDQEFTIWVSRGVEGFAVAHPKCLGYICTVENKT